MSQEPTDTEIPRDWDRIRESTDDPVAETVEHELEIREGPEPAVVSLVGSAWGDLVAVLGVCTLALLGLALLGYRAELAMLPWTLALAVAWWAAATAIMVLVRHGTPGMLMAGVAFDRAISRGRIPAVLLAALVLWCTLGVLALLGARRSPLRFAAGVDLVTQPKVARGRRADA
jgi:hypothetical protein